MRMMDTLYLQEQEIYHVPDQILVKIKHGQIVQFMNRVSLFGLRILKRMHLLAGDFVVIKTSPKPILGVLSLLGNLPEVEYAEPNYTAKSALTKSYSDAVTDPDSPWQKLTVKQADIDLIDAGKLASAKNRNFVEANIKDLLFLSDVAPLNLAEAVEVIDYATKMEVDVVSKSWVKDGFSKALDDAIKVAGEKGISFVAASVNENSSDSDTRPAANVSANVLSLYIAQEAKEGKSGRGRLIAKSTPSAEQIKNEWHSGARHQNSSMVSQNFSFPGAKFIKLEVAKFNADSNLELIKVRNSSGMIVQNISRSPEVYETDYVETNLIVVEFHSSAFTTSMGSIIRNVRVIY